MNKNISPLKKITAWLLIVFLGVAVLTLIAVSQTVLFWARSLSPARTITVEAEGKAVLRPDTATITLSVISEGGDPAALQQDNNVKVNRAIAFVKQQGVDPQDVQTSNYALSPRYRYEPKSGRQFIDGYIITQTVTVKIRNLMMVNAVIGGLPALGINQLSGPHFVVDDPDRFLDSARAEAFRRAALKAQTMAAHNGVRLERVVTFNEQSQSRPPMPFLTVAREAAGGMELPDIEPGSEEARVRVSVTYEIR